MDMYAELCRADVKPIDMHRQMASNNIQQLAQDIIIPGEQLGVETSSHKLDWHRWLPFAAKSYHISSDPRDYVVVPTPMLPLDLPNRNGVAFPLVQAVQWMPDYGMQAYETFRHKPTFYEHDNEDITKAKGVILDVFLRKVRGHGRSRFWTIYGLLAFDRTKDRDLAEKILRGERNSYSMGAFCNTYTCSYCGKEIGKCDHINKNRPLDFYTIDSNLVYRQVVEFCGFECSSVETPAYSSVLNNTRFDVKEGKKRQIMYT